MPDQQPTASTQQPTNVVAFDARFEAAVAFTLKWETVFTAGHDGDYSNEEFVVTENDPNDPGGATRYGIDQRSHPNVDVRNLTLTQAKRIYFDGEWTKCRCAELPVGIGEFVFDSAVNVGMTRAVQFLQKAVDQEAPNAGVIADGFIGPITLASAQSVPSQNLADTIRYIYRDRLNYYEAIGARNPALQKFLKGWQNRIEALETFCLGLLNAQPTQSGGNA